MPKTTATPTNIATCSIEGCKRPSRARKMCEAHYKKYHRFGNPLARRFPGTFDREQYLKSDCATYKRLLWQAKVRELQVSLSFDEYVSLRRSPCHYCGIEFIAGRGIRIDRKNNDIGYLKNNCVPCCGDCNKIKNNILNEQEMLVAMKAILEYRNQKSND